MSHIPTVEPPNKCKDNGFEHMWKPIENKYTKYRSFWGEPHPQWCKNCHLRKEARKHTVTWEEYTFTDNP